MVMTIIPENLVVIIKEVGFFVGRRFQPVNVQSFASTYWRMARSIKRQISREIKKDKTKRFDSFSLFEKNAVYNCRIFQKAEVLFNADLAFV